MNEQFVALVEAALSRAGVLRGDATLLVALSGGADSVALLLAVCGIRDRVGLKVCAAHVEHGLRGETALADAQFCEQLCERLHVPFACDHANLTGGMTDSGAETRARDARYTLLFARARQWRADALLTAHHLDDQAETVLSHLIRGSGARGLGGMREVSRRDGITLVRPLLALPKQALLAALDGLPHRDDESNAEPCCQRNRLRTWVIPLLTAENPRAAEHIAQSAALLALDDDCLQTQADALLKAAWVCRPPFCYLRKDTVAQAPQAIAVRALRSFVEQSAARRDGRAWEESLSAGDAMALLALLNAPQGTTLNLPRELRAVAGASRIHLLPMDGDQPLFPAPIPPPVSMANLPDTIRFGEVTLRLDAGSTPGDQPPDGVRAVAVPTRRLARCVVRAAMPGDRIAPFGACGSKPLRRYMTDHKVDAPFRPYVPLLCEGREVLWAVGVGAAESTRLTGAPTTQLTVTGDLPWV